MHVTQHSQRKYLKLPIHEIDRNERRQCTCVREDESEIKVSCSLLTIDKKHVSGSRLIIIERRDVPACYYASNK